MDTQNDGLEKVVPFKYGHFWYMLDFWGYNAFFVDLFDDFIHVFHRPIFHLLSDGIKGRNSSKPQFSSPERNPLADHLINETTPGCLGYRAMKSYPVMWGS